MQRASKGSVVLRWLPVAAGVFVTAGAIGSLFGFIINAPRLLSWNAGDIHIKANTALCLTSIGLALLVSASAPRRKVTIRILAAFACATGGLTLLQHVTGINLGIDTLIVDEPPGAPATTSPGRMGMPASISLTLLGSALILCSHTPARRQAATLALLALTISSLSLTGYLFGANQLYALPRSTGIAMQTAAMIAVASVGIIALVREHGLAATLLRSDAGGTMFRRLFIPVVLVSLVLGSVRLFLEDYGYVDAAFGTAARTLAEIIVLVTLLWWTAESLSRSEERARQALTFRSENETLRRIAIAQESERRRIARDVHDHIGQSLTALRLKLDALQRQTPLDQDRSVDVTGLCEHAKKLDADVSLLVWQMRPGVLDTHGLASALNSFVREWSANYGIEAEIQSTSSHRRLPPELETNLYRIIQEALNNILKHANATKVSISLHYLSDEVVVVIEDNGSGFDAEAERIHTTDGSGYGIIGMSERASLIGGKLEIESTPGTGTTIYVRVPVPHAEHRVRQAAAGT